MSIGSGSLEYADEPDTEPPYTAQQVALSDWPDRVKRAWNAFNSVNKDDTVIWGERSKPLTVRDISVLGDGEKNVEVEGPRGGTYTLRERYDDQGNPKYYADDSKAMDLELYEDESVGDMRPFTEDMYESVVSNLERAAINAYASEEDPTYESWEDAVSAVVTSWIADVEFQRWAGWPYEWEQDDATYIFRMVREHADRMPEVGPTQGGEETQNPSTTPKEQARIILNDVVRQRGRELAHEKLIESEQDYRAIVLQLADDAIDTNDLKANLDARSASAQTVENFIDAHSEPLWKSIIQFSDFEPDDISLYEGLDPEDITREMAYDALDEDVWARARAEHRDRGTHDPTVRGLAFFEYDELIEILVEKTLREHAINDNKRLFTTAKQIARGFAENVENGEWPYDVGGVDEQTWGVGDREDIYTSIAMHAEPDPKIFNPYSGDRERKAAVQVITEVVHERASSAMDAKQQAETKPVPADDYLDEELNSPLSFNDIRDDMDLKPKDFIAEAMTSAGDTDNLAGYTFVDELVEAAGATVPHTAGEWQLVDYGLVRTNSKERQLAYFDRSSGDVITLTGQVDGRPIDGDYTFGDSWNVELMTWDGDDAPVYLQSDVSLEFAFEFVRQYVGADKTDINVIETSDGEHYIQESIEEDDIDTSSITGGAARSFRTPGPGLSTADKLVYGREIFKRVSEWLTQNSRLAKSVAVVAAGSVIADIPYLMYASPIAMTAEPYFDKKYGVGIKASSEFGQNSNRLEQYDPDDPDDKFYQGRIDAKATITPGFFKHVGDSITPEWLYQKGPNATVINTVRTKIEEPIRQRTGDFSRAPRVAFLGAHVPENARGPPSGTNDYVEEQSVSVNYDGENITRTGVKYPDNLITTQGDQLITDAALPENRVKMLLARLARHGYITETRNGAYAYTGDDDLDDYVTDPYELHDGTLALDPAEVQLLGYSLRRKFFLGQPGVNSQTMFGTPSEVAENVDEDVSDITFNDGDSILEPVCTYKAFLNIWTDLPGTPNTTILSTVWEFYKERAEDTDEMTLLDAYNRYRMGIVYQTIEAATINEIGKFLSDVAKDPERDLRDVFQKAHTKGSGTTELVYKPTERQLHPAEVFDSVEQDPLPEFLIFHEKESSGKDWRPSRDVTHYIWNEEFSQYEKWDAGANQQIDWNRPPEELDNINQRSITNYQSLYRELTKAAQREIATRVEQNDIKGLVTDPEEFDPDNPVPEEDRKWLDKSKAERIQAAARGSADWDDLDGTDLSIFGLFMRGLDMEDAEKLANQFDLSDRFRTRLTDLVPESSLPDRTDRPSFQQWLDRRRGVNAIGSATEKARAKAQYLREIAGTASESPTSRDQLGYSTGAMDDSERNREIREMMPDTDYQDFEEFYGEQFGNAFDDVARKFNETQTTDEVDPIGDTDLLVADDQPNTGPAADYDDDDSSNDNNDS